MTDNENYNDFIDKYETHCHSRVNKHIKRTDTYKIADKRAGNKLSKTEYMRVKKYYKMTNNRAYDRDIKYI